jgi:hypothetical protein
MDRTEPGRQWHRRRVAQLGQQLTGRGCADRGTPSTISMNSHGAKGFAPCPIELYETRLDHHRVQLIYIKDYLYQRIRHRLDRHQSPLSY